MLAEYMTVLFILNNKMNYSEIGTSLRVTDSELNLFFAVQNPLITSIVNHGAAFPCPNIVALTSHPTSLISPQLSL